MDANVEWKLPEISDFVHVEDMGLHAPPTFYHLNFDVFLDK